jgi:putative membrane protein insertion efficiency factor
MNRLSLASLTMAPLTVLLRALIRGYQLLIAPLIPASCRYLPSCSAYAAEALDLHGPVKGGWLAVRRLLRCHPWGGSGFDPVPRPDPSGNGCRHSH